MTNTYLTNSKVRFIKEARDDFKRIYGLDHTPFTRKIYFYFFEHNNKKYIHKRALNFVYTNADTYTKEVDPYYCYLTKQTSPPDIYTFLESYQGTLLPKLLESNDSFLVYEYWEGDPVESISAQEFQYLNAQHEQLALTPFYNSMTYNLARNGDQIKLIDFKHFEPKDSKPFFIYLYNEDNRVNTLYVKKGTNMEPIADHLGIDYPVLDANIIEY
jgi:hypothetical protein